LHKLSLMKVRNDRSVPEPNSSDPPGGPFYVRRRPVLQCFRHHIKSIKCDGTWVDMVEIVYITKK
jgi:hypothetical protein